MAFRDRLKEARLKKGFTQEELASHIGVAKSTLTGYEKGNREPNMATVTKMMDILDVDANYLWQDEAVHTANFGIQISDTSEYPLISKYRRLTDTEKNRIDELIDRTLSGQPLTDAVSTQKKPAPTNEGELDEAIINMILQLQLTPYELQRLVDFAKGIAAARTAPPSDQH